LSRSCPAIVQLSPGEADFWGMAEFLAIVKVQKNEAGLFSNYDHGRAEAMIKKAIDLGFDMVHFDGSSFSWRENIDQTKKVVALAHKKGILVEGEPEAELTDPQKAAEFAAETQVDLLAVFAGNKHGFNPDKEEALDIDRLRAIKKAVGGKVGLTLHGASGVGQKKLEEAIREKLVTKLNINSKLRFVYRRALEQAVESNPTMKIYRLIEPVLKVVESEVGQFLDLVGGKS